MLPFLKLNNEAAGSGPVETKVRKPDEEADYDMLEAASDDIIAAVHAKDSKALTAALRAAFEMLDSEPHFEGDHTNE